MLRTMNFHLRDTFRARGEDVEAEAAAAEASRANSESQEEEEVDVGEEEMQVMRVRLLRDHWLHYLGAAVFPPLPTGPRLDSYQSQAHACWPAACRLERAFVQGACARPRARQAASPRLARHGEAGCWEAASVTAGPATSLGSGPARLLALLALLASLIAYPCAHLWCRGYRGPNGGRRGRRRRAQV